MAKAFVKLAALHSHPGMSWESKIRTPVVSDDEAQAREYERLMGRPWSGQWSDQFYYTPRSKYGRQLLAQMHAQAELPAAA